MTLAIRATLALALGAATFGLSAAASAQGVDGDHLPTCSASVTDHCIQHEGRHTAAAHHQATKHHSARHHPHTAARHPGKAQHRMAKMSAKTPHAM